jgi:hypothetical protein
MRGRATPLKQYERPARPLDRDARHAVNMIAWVSADGAGAPAHVVDLSERGFGAKSWALMRIGSEIKVSLPGLGIVRAQVRWALGGVFGACFLPRLDAEQLETCLERAAMGSEPG